MSADSEKLRCSFCNKPALDVALLIAAPKDIFICDECVELSRDIIGAQRQNGTVVKLIKAHKPPIE